MEDEVESYEDIVAGIKSRAAQARAVAAMPAIEQGAGGGMPGPAAGVKGAVEGAIASPLGKLGSFLDGTVKWVKNLPRNISLGALDAAQSSINALNDAANSDTAQGVKGAMLGVPAGAVPTTAVSPFDREFSEWRRGLRAEDDMSDALTQGIAQFAVPFTAFSKGMGVMQAPTTAGKLALGAGAEAAATALGFESDTGRLTELFELGRQSEGKLGDVLNTIAPDGSLVNSYIDWMNEREGETALEARFKNTIDGLAGSAVVASMLKAAGLTYKASRNLPAALAENPKMPGRLSTQEGKIVFHGTPHEVDEFDLSKIGSGEGQQAHGYGLYFAEAKDVANTYRGSNSIVHRLASASMYKHKNDWQKAVADLKARGDNRSAAAARALEQGKGTIAGGNLYSVDIPDEAIGKMLDADKPLADQPEVLSKLVKAGYSPSSATETGGEFVRRYGREGFDAVLAQDLAKADIPGIRFLDGRSRKNGPEGTRNIVLFDDKLAKIISKE
jgi:hypothetical protein